MDNHIERLHSLLPHGAAFPDRAVRPTAVRFADRSKVVEGCRKIALQVVRKVEHMNNCSYVLSSPKDRCYLMGG